MRRVLCSVPAMTRIPAARNAATYASTTAGAFRFGISSATWMPRASRRSARAAGGSSQGQTGRRTVGQRRVAGDPVHLEDQPVGVVERDRRLGTKAGRPAFMRRERISSWTAIGSLDGRARRACRRHAASSSRRRSGATARKIASWNAIATWRSWSTTQSRGTPACSATSSAMFSAVSAVAKPAAGEALAEQRAPSARSVRRRSARAPVREAPPRSRRRRERVDALAAQVHPARVRRVVDPHARRRAARRPRR